MYFSSLVLLATSFLTAPGLCAVSSRKAQAPPTVKVLNGTYAGVHSDQFNQDFFLGMPYSQPPVGDLRFRVAQSLNTSWTGTKDATEYSLECIGYGSDQWVLGNMISEDCLTLNVIRPSGQTGKQLPVAVWIHGGGFTEGGNADPRYNLSFIVQQSTEMNTPMIGVSINYRLQAWGFIFGEEIAAEGSTNLGVRDQRLALHWIQENIGAFGGDPTKVTIWGESAGGFSIGSQLVAYGGRDDKLFRGAISESGVAVSLAPHSITPQSWQPFYNRITAAAGCSSAADTLACLRTVPTQTLSNIFNSSVTAGAPFSVVIDNDFFIDSGTNLTVNGQFVRVPYLLGTNHDEGTAFGARGINTTAQFIQSVEAGGVDPATAAVIGVVYPDIPQIGIPPTFIGSPPASQAFGLQFKRAAAYGGDRVMQAPRRLTSQSWAKFNTPAYTYVFDIIPNGLNGDTGATHFQEVAFVFHNIQGVGYQNVVAVPPFEGKPETYVQAATIMSRSWVSFVVFGDPNHSGVNEVEWPVYTLDNPQNIVFSVNVSRLAFVEQDLWRAEAIAYLSETVLAN